MGSGTCRKSRTPRSQTLVYRWNWLSSSSLTKEGGRPPLICVVSHKSERESAYCGVYISILVYSKAGGEPDQYRRAVTVDYLLTSPTCILMECFSYTANPADLKTRGALYRNLGSANTAPDGLMFSCLSRN